MTARNAKTEKLTAWDLAALENLVRNAIDGVPNGPIDKKSLEVLWRNLILAKTLRVELKDPRKYSVYKLDTKWIVQERFADLDEAIAFGRSKGFEFAVRTDEQLVGSCNGPSLSWTPNPRFIS